MIEFETFYISFLSTGFSLSLSSLVYKHYRSSVISSFLGIVHFHLSLHTCRGTICRTQCCYRHCQPHSLGIHRHKCHMGNPSSCPFVVALSSFTSRPHCLLDGLFPYNIFNRSCCKFWYNFSFEENCNVWKDIVDVTHNPNSKLIISTKKLLV